MRWERDGRNRKIRMRERLVEITLALFIIASASKYYVNIK